MKVYEYMGIEYKMCLDDSRYPCVCEETKGDNADCIHIDNGGMWNNCEQGFSPAKNGNLMVLAINAMSDRGDYDSFERFIFDAWYKTNREDRLCVWLFGNPAKFFELMEAWREEVEKK